MGEISFQGVKVNYIDVEANPELGFYFPFKIIIPKNLNDNPELIYACNLTSDNSKNGSSMEKLIELSKELYKKENDRFSSIDPVLFHLCIERGNPMVIPFIPRLKYFRPNFLGRDCLLNDFKLKGSDIRFEQYMYMYNNLADQHKAIIEFAIDCLKTENIDVEKKAILGGYSEGAKFVSHLALLHPEIIKAIIAGGTGGTMSMPISELEGYEFVYPTGISGLDNFDFESFKKIAFFYYMGDNDKSDSAIPYFEEYYYINKKGKKELLTDECGNPTPYIDENGNQVFILDKNGDYTSKFGLFSNSELNAINKVFGTIMQDRFKKQEKVYKSLDLESTFKLYKGNHHSIFEKSDLIFSDVDSFIENQINNNIPSQKQI